jgi:hypothetical protein
MRTSIDRLRLQFEWRSIIFKTEGAKHPTPPSQVDHHSDLVLEASTKLSAKFGFAEKAEVGSRL